MRIPANAVAAVQEVYPLPAEVISAVLRIAAPYVERAALQEIVKTPANIEGDWRSTFSRACDRLDQLNKEISDAEAE